MILSFRKHVCVIKKGVCVCVCVCNSNLELDQTTSSLIF